MKNLWIWRGAGVGDHVNGGGVVLISQIFAINENRESFGCPKAGAES